VVLHKKIYNCRSGRGKMQERNTENCHRYARTPSMILIPHDLFVESAGILSLEIQIFWDMVLHYWSSGSCCFEGCVFLQKAGNHSPSDTASQVKKKQILPTACFAKFLKVQLIKSYAS